VLDGREEKPPIGKRFMLVRNGKQLARLCGCGIRLPAKSALRLEGRLKDFNSTSTTLSRLKRSL
jgi:hypothetical protein